MNHRDVSRSLAPSFWVPALAAALLVTAGVPRRAHAQATDAEKRTIAEALFTDASALQAKGDYAQACPKFAEVTKLQPGKVGALFALAGCYEAAGKFASAKTTYETAERAATAAADPRAATAHDKAAALASKIPKLSVVVPDAIRAWAGLSIKRDDLDVSAPLWGVAIPLDPGTHVVTATAPGKKAWTTQVDVQAGTEASTVTVPVLDDDVAAGPAVPPGGPDTTAPHAAKAPAWAWAVGGVGLAALGVATGFGIDALGAQSAINKNCAPAGSPYACTKNDTSITSENSRKDTGFGVFLGLGVVGVGAITAAIVGIVKPPAAKAPSTTTGRLQFVPMMSPNGGGAVLRGGF